jgi:uncharacterized repeat protein (TIGR03803 family)
LFGSVINVKCHPYAGRVPHGGNEMKSLMKLSVVLVFVLGVLTAHLHGQRLGSSAIDFGGWPVGVTSVQYGEAFTNTGNAELTLSITLSGGPFAMPVNDCGRGVKPQTHCNIYLTYTPKVLGEQDQGTVTFSYTGSGGSGSVSASLSGVGSGPFGTSTSMSFGPDGNVFNFATATYSPYQIPLGESILNTCTNQTGSVVSYTAQITASSCSKKSGCDAFANWTQPIQSFNYGLWSCQGEYVGDVEFAPSSGEATIVQEQGQTATVLYNFTGNSGESPMSNLLFDTSGNLYGTTEGGGLYGYGTVFELSPNGGGWNETVLYSFTGGTDGGEPSGPITLDPLGNLYGTAGGANGFGVAWELSRVGTSWTEAVLYSFTDGTYPGLIMDPAGNLYGSNDTGVFELSPSGGSWTEQSIYNGAVGHGLAMDGSGNIFFLSTVESGRRTRTRGTVVELSLNSGVWDAVVIHTFAPLHYPGGTLAVDKAGNVYGFQEQSTFHGVQISESVYILQRAKGWAQKTLYGQTVGSFDGISLDDAEDIFVVWPGTNSDNYGAMFELTAPSYTEGSTWNFNGPDGQQPYSRLIADSAGNLYGTTQFGGSNGYGVVFEVTP